MSYIAPTENVTHPLKMAIVGSWGGGYTNTILKQYCYLCSLTVWQSLHAVVCCTYIGEEDGIICDFECLYAV